MVERRKLDAVGGFDESFVVGGNDVDLCLRLTAAGHRSLCVPHVRAACTTSRPAATRSTLPAGDFERSRPGLRRLPHRGRPVLQPRPDAGGHRPARCAAPASPAGHEPLGPQARALRLDASRARGPTEAGYAYFRARRRRRNLADDELELTRVRPARPGAAITTSTRRTPGAQRRGGGAAGERSAPHDIALAPVVPALVPPRHRRRRPHRPALRRPLRAPARRGQPLLRLRPRRRRRDAADVAARHRGRVSRRWPARRHVAAAEPLGAQRRRHRHGLAQRVPARAPPRQRAPSSSSSRTTSPPSTRRARRAPCSSRRRGWGCPGSSTRPGLADVYRGYGNRGACRSCPAVDLDRYHPPAAAAADGPVRVFFYGRPSQARNAFGLGPGRAAGRQAPLRRARARSSAPARTGARASTGSPTCSTTSASSRDLDAVAELYRSCHVGLCFMLTPHPSYQPLEFMASGMATVSNDNPHTGWLLRDERELPAGAGPAERGGRPGGAPGRGPRPARAPGRGGPRRGQRPRAGRSRSSACGRRSRPARSCSRAGPSLRRGVCRRSLSARRERRSRWRRTEESEGMPFGLFKSDIDVTVALDRDVAVPGDRAGRHGDDRGEADKRTRGARVELRYVNEYLEDGAQLQLQPLLRPDRGAQGDLCRRRPAAGHARGRAVHLRHPPGAPGRARRRAAQLDARRRHGALGGGGDRRPPARRATRPPRAP